jgi:hypothetical protein
VVRSTKSGFGIALLLVADLLSREILEVAE